jgi:hypothetical protein
MMKVKKFSELRPTIITTSVVLSSKIEHNNIFSFIPIKMITKIEDIPTLPSGSIYSVRDPDNSRGLIVTKVKGFNNAITLNMYYRSSILIIKISKEKMTICGIKEKSELDCIDLILSYIKKIQYMIDRCRNNDRLESTFELLKKLTKSDLTDKDGNVWTKYDISDISNLDVGDEIDMILLKYFLSFRFDYGPQDVYIDEMRRLTVMNDVIAKDVQIIKTQSRMENYKTQLNVNIDRYKLSVYLREREYWVSYNNLEKPEITIRIFADNVGDDSSKNTISLRGDGYLTISSPNREEAEKCYQFIINLLFGEDSDKFHLDEIN